MGKERVIFSNRFDRPTLEQIEEEMKKENYDDNENLMSAEEFLLLLWFRSVRCCRVRRRFLRFRCGFSIPFRKKYRSSPKKYPTVAASWFHQP